MLFHVADHLADLILLFGSGFAGRGFSDEQTVTQPSQEFVKVINGLTGSERENVVGFLNGSFTGQCRCMSMHQGANHFTVDHPESEGGHVCVFQEMQQIADPAVQNFAAPQGQRLADGCGDLPGLGQDRFQV